MISDIEKQMITDCANRYGVRRILLFGSALKRDTGYGDIDLAVDGLDPKLFFKFYGELIRKLNKSIDLIDLGEHTPFTEYIASEGIPLYG